MPYIWRLAGDALVDLRQLDPVLQEDALDEIERAVAAPESLDFDRSGVAVVEFDREIAGTLHFVSVRLLRDDAQQRFVVLGMGDKQRRDPAG